MHLTFVTLALASTILAAPTEHQKLRRADGETKPNSYIVKLKDGVSIQDSVSSVVGLESAENSTAQIVYSDWTVINAYSAVLTGAALDHVLADPDVEYVEEDHIVSIDYAISPRQDDTDPAPSDPAPSDPAPVDPEEASIQANNGLGINFYGVDTGIWTTHAAFTGRASWGATFGGFPNTDDNGHGTHTAATATGVGFGPATKSKIYAVKVLPAGGSGPISNIIAGINWAVNHAVNTHKPSVINLSLGGGISQALDDSVKKGIARGVHFTIAAGNSNTLAQNTSPARVQEAVTVGAVDRSNIKACFSNYGSVLDVWDLGVDVRSAWRGSNTATNIISGTSMAAPGVAGKLLVALAKFGQMTPANLSNKLKQAAQHKVICTTAPLAFPCATNPPKVTCSSRSGTTDLLARPF